MPESQLFQKLSREAFTELLETSFKSLSQKIQPSESLSHYKRICSSSDIEFSELEPSLQLFHRIIRDAGRKQKTTSQVLSELLSIGMNEDQVDIFSKQWDKVQSTLVVPTAADYMPINPLVDMEWKFGVSSASSQLNSVGNVFLQIKLEVDQGNGRTKTVCFELQLSEFYAFLHEMERARASLDYLS